MAKQILVPLNRADRVDEIVPFVEKVAQSGMKIVFLVHWPKDEFSWLFGVQTEMETGIGTTLAAMRTAESLNLERQQRIAEQEFFPACQSLQSSGLEIAVDVYTSSLRKAVGRYASKGDIQVLMMPSGIGAMFMNILHGTLSTRRLFGTSTSSPVLVFYPGRP